MGLPGGGKLGVRRCNGSEWASGRVGEGGEGASKRVRK